MTNMLRRLWNDDKGAVVSVELVLVIGVLVFGIIPGLVALRNGINASLGTLANSLNGFVPSFTYSGWQFNPAGGGSAIALVQGYQQDPGTSQNLAAARVAPISLGAVSHISPAP